MPKLLIFDGNCGFCRIWIEYWKKLTADRIEPGAASWYAAGHRSTEPAQTFALEKLGLEPLLDLGMRLGEGSGEVAAVPVVRSAIALLRDVALLSDLLP